MPRRKKREKTILHPSERPPLLAADLPREITSPEALRQWIAERGDAAELRSVLKLICVLPGSLHTDTIYAETLASAVETLGTFLGEQEEWEDWQPGAIIEIFPIMMPLVDLETMEDFDGF